MQQVLRKIRQIIPVKPVRGLGWFCLAAFLIPLVLYSIIGFYTRYAADDYETAGALQRYGLWGAQQYWYLNWSGRYAYFFIISVFQAIGGIRAVPYLTLVCLSLWLLGLSWFFAQLLERGRIHQPRQVAALGAALVLTVTLRGLLHINQILFWQTGIMTYVFYLLLFTLSAAVLLWRFLKWPARLPGFGEVTAWGILAFILAGLSELSTVLQLAAVFSGLALILLVRTGLRTDGRVRSAALPIFMALALASVAGFVIMYLAPGNAVRALKFPVRPGLVDLMLNSIYYTLNFVGRWLANQGVLALLATLFPLVMGLAVPQNRLPDDELRQHNRRLSVYFVVSAGVLFLLLWSGNFTGYYTTTDEPPARSLVMPQFFLTLFLVGWSFVSGWMLQQSIQLERGISSFLKWVGWGVVLVLLFFGPFYDSTRIFTLLAPARERAIEWDARDRAIREAVARGERSVTVWYIYDPNGLGDYNIDPEFLVNRAAADYYGLDSIIALDKQP